MRIYILLAVGMVISFVLCSAFLGIKTIADVRLALGCGAIIGAAFEVVARLACKQKNAEDKHHD